MSTQHLHQSLRWFFGIAAVVTDLGHVLLVDLCLDDLSCSQSELEASGRSFRTCLTAAVVDESIRGSGDPGSCCHHNI